MMAQLFLAWVVWGLVLIMASLLTMPGHAVVPTIINDLVVTAGALSVAAIMQYINNKT